MFVKYILMDSKDKYELSTSAITGILMFSNAEIFLDEQQFE